MWYQAGLSFVEGMVLTRTGTVRVGATHTTAGVRRYGATHTTAGVNRYGATHTTAGVHRYGATHATAGVHRYARHGTDHAFCHAPLLMTSQALNAFLDMATFFTANTTEYSAGLLCSLYDDVLLRGRLWARASPSIQLSLYQTIFNVAASSRVDLRAMGGVGRLLNTLFRYQGNAAGAGAGAGADADAGAGAGLEMHVADELQTIRSLIIHTCGTLLQEQLPTQITSRELEHLIGRTQTIAGTLFCLHAPWILFACTIDSVIVHPWN
jgi:hypothetical protein